MNQRQKICLTWTVITILLLSACGNQSAPAATPYIEDNYFPNAEWRTSTPAEQGIDPELLNRMLEEIDRLFWDVDNITIIRHGYKVFDVSLGSYQADELHILYSCTKSVVSALVGIAIDQGFIDSKDATLVSLFPARQIDNMEPRKEAITLEHLLSMTSGFDCRDSYLYQWEGLNEMFASDDWIQHVLDLPMKYQPGTYFEYCNGVSNLLSAIVQASSGIQTAAFAEQLLFTPLGIEEYFWEQDPDGHSLGFSELYLKPSDMARFGYLYLHGGRWDGQQIISSEWVSASTKFKVAATLQDGYGYQWWIDGAGYYMALGYRGQFIFVLPEYDMVVVIVSDPEVGDYDAPEYLLTNYIIPAVES
jgi:CubicO group peptidase (beta-lactamase class C family)